MKFDQIEEVDTLARELKRAYEVMEIIQSDGAEARIEVVLDKTDPTQPYSDVAESQYRFGSIQIDLATGKALIEDNVQAQIDSITARLKMLGVDL